jgi:hypothetical protein
VTESAIATKGRRAGLLAVLVAVLFGLLFAYDTWEAIQNAIEVPKLFAQLEAVGLPAGDVPWLLIGVGIALPPLAYAIALFAGRRRSVAMKALILLLALAAVAALSLTVNALAVA